MEIKEIISSIDDLTLEEKQALLAAVTQSIESDSLTLMQNDVISRYIQKMKELTRDDFLDGRESAKTNARVVLTICLNEAGFSISKIAKMMKKDHSTVVCYKKKWNDALTYPRVFKDLISLYNKFKAAL